MYISTFKGLIPRMSHRNKDDTFATIAHNVDLSKGSLTPWGAPVALHTNGAARSFYVHGCCYHTWDTCVLATEWLATSRRLFITGRRTYPEVIVTGKNCTHTYYRLGVPTPRTAPFVGGGGGASKDSDARDYVFTYVNALGEEGAPSYPSGIVTVADGSAVTVNGLTSPSPEYGVVKLRIYRSATGQRAATEILENVTGRYLVGEVPVGTPAFVDTRSAGNLGFGLYTHKHREPPPNLKQIIQIEGETILCGFTNNKIFFSETREPHNWPIQYELTLDENIVSICQVNSAVFVGTTGAPYTIAGAHPCTGAERTVDKHTLVLPMVSCTPRGMVATPFGAVYVSNDGLALIPPRGEVKVISQAMWSSKQWQLMHPESMVLGYYGGQLYISSHNATYIFPLDTELYELKDVYVTTSDIRAEQYQASSNGQLLFLSNGVVYQWDAGDPTPYTWQVTIANGMSSITAVRALFDTVGCVDVTVENKLNSTTRTICTEKPVRFPRIGRAEEFTITVKGVAEVTRLGYDTSVAESVWEGRKSG